jgi:hypothetical protein
LLRLPQERVGGSTGRRTRCVVLETIPWIAQARRSPAKSAKVPTMSELGPTDPSLAHRCEMNDGTQVAEKKAEGALEEYVLARQRPRRRSVLHNGTWKHDLDKPTAASAAARARTHVRTNT